MKPRTLIVSAPRHSYKQLPMRVSLADKKQVVSAIVDAETGRWYAAQTCADGLCWILDRLDKGESRRFTLVSDLVECPRFELVDSAGICEFRIGEELVTSYHYGADVVRPYLYPVIGPGGACVTRQYPMRDDIPGEARDHKHHKSVWVAHGDVNGVDDWSEDTGHGRIVHREFLEKISGPVFGRVRTLNDWVSSDGVKVMEEERTITIYNLPGEHRFIDVGVVFCASEGDVRFGDTKEGGILSVRVATSMDGNKGGLITNSFGGVKEAETWGKRAHWCDYSGPVDGHTVGISVFDNPGNFRYPAYWHVRDYGLMTVNPFALAEYYGDPKRDGSHTVAAGGVFPFAFRIFVHDGDAAGAVVAQTYHGYINPPSVESD